MSSTPLLALPLIAAAQAQKHVTHNEAIATLDGLVHLAVKERNRLTPPGSPEAGDRYLIGAGATGAFAGKDGLVALFDAGAWRFLPPRAGFVLYVVAEDLLLVFDGAQWRKAAQNESVDRLAINTAADSTNRLSVRSNAALFTATQVADGGSGDLRLALNKEAAGNTAAIVYQRGFSARAEMGLSGDDDFRLRVSADGATWREALRIDRASGDVALPLTAPGLRNLLVNSEFAVNQRAFAGGSLGTGVYGFDRWKCGAGSATLSLAADGTLTLSGSLVQVIEAPGLAGQAVTVSVENPSGPVSVDVAGAVGTIAAGAGRRSLALTVPAAATGDVALTLQGTNVSFARPMLCRGTLAPAFERVPLALTLMLCQRYYEKSYALAAVPGAITTTGVVSARATTANQTSIEGLSSAFLVRKRAVPTITWYSSTGLAGALRDVTGAVDRSVTATNGSTDARTGIPVITTGTSAGNLFQAHWIAQAEL